jgi:hypothetical protein
MKHIIETHQDYLKLKEYLKKLESLAEKMGVEVDDLLSETTHDNKKMYMLFRKKFSSISQKRISILNAKKENDFRMENRSELMLIKNFTEEKKPLIQVD